MTAGYPVELVGATASPHTQISAAGGVERPRSTLFPAFSLPRRMGLEANRRVPAHYLQTDGGHPGHAQHPYRWPLKCNCRVSF